VLTSDSCKNCPFHVVNKRSRCQLLAYRSNIGSTLAWAYGYAKRFGLVHVGYATQRRTIKLSGLRYAEIIRAHRQTAQVPARPVGIP
jgi:hypothetical protein